MRAPSFWWRTPGVQARLLGPLAEIYGNIAQQRFSAPGQEIGIPVVCVGNLTVGGTGKTPAALALARLLIAAGERVWLLSRGYGGRRAGPLIVDPGTHRASEVGDEPLLLARVAPTVVARDRPAGARIARDAGASVIVMDDGFQNPSLTKTLAVLTIDGPRGIGNGLVFPAGPLRAPLARQLKAAQAMIVVGDISGAGAVVAAAKAAGLTVFYGRLEPDADTVAGLADKRVLAFAGIGDPDKFFATLGEAGIKVQSRRGFADHHRYRKAEADRLLAEAERDDLMLLTTEKDLIRIRTDPGLERLAGRALALPVELALYREQEFDVFLRTAIARVAIARAG